MLFEIVTIRARDGIYQEMSAFKLVGICCIFAAEEGGEGQNHLVLGRGRKENINDAWSMPVDRTLELSGGQQPCPLFPPPQNNLKTQNWEVPSVQRTIMESG